MTSILQPWVENLGLRHQGVLMSAMRGCDIAPRHDPSKIAQRLLRGAVLIPHCGRFSNPKSYIQVEEDPDKWALIMKNFVSNWDHYPNHYVFHFIHAVEIIGYHGPSGHPSYASRWNALYATACLALHLNPETRQQLDNRLNAEEELFYQRQEVMRGERL